MLVHATCFAIGLPTDKKMHGPSSIPAGRNHTRQITTVASVARMGSATHGTLLRVMNNLVFNAIVTALLELASEMCASSLFQPPQVLKVQQFAMKQTASSCCVLLMAYQMFPSLDFGRQRLHGVRR